MTETKLQQAPVIAVVASMNRHRLWDLEHDMNRLGELMTDDLEVISRIDNLLMTAAVELGKIADKYAKIAGEK
jgi:hypothetical protein